MTEHSTESPKTVPGMDGLPIQDRQDGHGRISEDAIHRAVTQSIDITPSPPNETTSEDDLSRPLYSSAFDNLLAITQDTFNFDPSEHPPDLTNYTDDPMKDDLAVSSWRGYRDPMEPLFTAVDEEFERELRGEIHQDLPDFIRSEPLTPSQEVLEQELSHASVEATGPIGEHGPDRHQLSPKEDRSRKRRASSQGALEKRRHTKKDSGVYIDLSGSDEDTRHDDTPHQEEASTPFDIPAPNHRGYVTHSEVWIDLFGSDNAIQHDDARQEERSTLPDSETPNPRDYLMHGLDEDIEECGITLEEMNEVGIEAGLPPIDFGEWLEGL
ncbi:hypothetical protein G7Y79_00021g049860 [Physcia stellaris]|nr:hypothetical protein G7Y79_00021g049860 [Physcia stellaris]